MTSNWKKCKLKDLCIDNKGSYGIAASAVEYSENLYTYLRISDITDVGTLSKSDLKSVADTDADKYLLQPNDIVFARTGGSTGRNYFYDGSDGPLVYAGFLIKFSINPSLINPKYLKYYCQSQTYKNWVNSFNTGSTRGNINAQTYGNMDILVPPRIQQDLLVSVLSAIDDKIELNNSINNNLEQQSMALFKQKIIKNCDNNKNGTIGEYCSVKSGYAFKGTWWKDNGVKVIKIKTIDNDSINFNDCSYVSNDKVEFAKDFIVQGGDLLIAMTGATIGKFAIIPKVNEPLLVNQRVGKFFLGSEPLNRLPFLYCSLKQQDIITEIINRGQGSAQPNISSSDIMTTPCYLPNDYIIDEFNELCKTIFETIITNKYENERLIQLRDTLLPKLMFGEIDVSNIEIDEILDNISTDKLSFGED